MNPRFLFHRVSLAGHMLLVFGLCTFGQAMARDTPLHDPVQIRAQVEFHILSAELAGQRGHLRFAAGEYLKALALIPDADLAERATRVALYAEADDLALRAAQVWVEALPGQHEARLLLVRLALRSKQVDLAYEQSQALLRNHPGGVTAVFRELARNLGGEIESGPSAQALMQRLVNDYPEEAAGHYALGLLALRQEDAPAAERAANQALAIEPDWADALLLKMTALLHQSRQEQADALMESLEGEDTWLVGMHMAYARLLLEAEQTEAAIQQFKAALDYESDNPEALYALALLHLNAEDGDAAYPYLEDLYDLETPRQSEAAYYLGSIEENRREYEDALVWYQRVKGGGHSMEATHRQAYVMYKLGRLPEARALLQELRTTHAEDAVRYYLMEGELLYQAHAFAEAALLYDQALQEYPDEPDLLYGRSLVSERLGRVTLAERDLRKLLEIDPEDPRSLNALGYILSNHSKRYDEALMLIDKALTKTPDDATVIDSMGWIMYRQGDLEAALRFLTEAFEKMPDPEVAAHLGEVLWQMGQRDRAQNIWRDALSEDPEHPILQETINRLTR